MTQKAITILVITAIIALLLATGVYFLFYTGTTPQEPSEPGSGLFPVGGDQPLGGLPGPGELLPGEVSEEQEFVQLSQNAISGAGSASSTIRYMEKATGHIYEISPNGKDRRRISNTTLLKTFEALWSPEADKLLMRYLENDDMVASVKTFSAVIDPVIGSIEGVFLPSETAAIAVSPEEDKLFYLNKLDNVTYGITANFKNERQKTVFSLPFGEFNVNWPNENVISLLTKPSSAVGGFLFFLNPNTMQLKKVLGGINGLTALVSPRGQKIIYSQSQTNSFVVKVFDVKKQISTDFGVKTLPEKCVWSNLSAEIVYCGVARFLPGMKYPDAWYKGKTSFQDSIWKINVASGETIRLLDEINMDVINPFLSQDEKYLIFTNKKDNILWSLRVKE